jgi:hypothetical protein
MREEVAGGGLLVVALLLFAERPAELTSLEARLFQPGAADVDVRHVALGKHHRLEARRSRSSSAACVPFSRSGSTRRLSGRGLGKTLVDILRRGVLSASVARRDFQSG